MTTKKELRKSYKLKRSHLSDGEMARLSSSVLDQLKVETFMKHQVYHIFLPIDRHAEIDTWPLFDALLAYGKRVVLSRSNFETNTLLNYEVDNSTIIESNAWGIPEPVNGKAIAAQDIDVVVVPLLAFDRSGYRVGYGKGFYDNFLAECRPDVEKIGLSVFGPEERIEDVRKEDIRLTHCVCPDRIYNFSE